MAARAGEKITLTYGRFDNKGSLKDGDGNLAPAFVEFVVKNDTGGGTTVTGAEGTLVSNTGQNERTTIPRFQQSTVAQSVHHRQQHRTATS